MTTPAPIEINATLDAAGLRFGIVLSRFNDLFGNQLLGGALDCLQRHGASLADVTIVRVPGAYEQPFALKRLAASGRFDALLALGCVIQGATPHASLINAQVTRALTQISLEHDLPVIDGIVAAESIDQAIERCGSKAGNRGWSSAQTAIEMASLARLLPPKKN
ncbi:MAG: 6,7-dimethyl-8-ribityllumazine synthase [Kiritimatiellae bacterium]|nr:6,7-dimethyl-8-ribityllumazine synthase [Kiritimatiellia bacterium]MBQ9345363.1 6,7-dimethyl-8-ribityllumazine synthase [Kiritimatiellia bacterium]